jgi:tetratricopeptide (TPR) repeat protein/DNA-binding transcriptional ArsR family regulator
MQHSLVSVFTPSLMSAEDLEYIFVQREPLAKDLVKRIVNSTKGSGKEHSLLIGMRGMGKTHMVSLVYHRIRSIPEIQDKILIAWLREEEWGVDSWLDLVMRIFRSITEDKNSADGNVAQELLDKLRQSGLENAKELATRFLRDLIGKRTLVLIIENMDDLFQGLGEIGQQKFRAFLQEYRCCTVLATTPALFKGVTSREVPFFGFFHRSFLESIEVDEAVKMLGQIASLNTVRDDHHDLAVFLQSAQGRARVRAVHHLAGGNPRVYTLFAQFMTRESLDDLVDAFMKMLDDLTPYYQARMKELSNQQRKIVELLVDRRQAVMVKDIGDTCFIDQRAVASQLRELKKKGYVVSNEVGRESFYELREVLMRFCMEVKKFRGRWVELIVDFLKIWYRPDQRQGMLEKFSDSKLINRVDLEQAFLSDDDPTGSICRENFRRSLQEQKHSLILQSAEELYSIGVISYFRYQEFISLIRDKKYQEILALMESTKASEFKDAIMGADYKKALEKSIESYGRLIAINPGKYAVWFNRGYDLLMLGRYEEAIKSYDKVLAIKPDHYKAWNGRGNALGNLEKYEEAIESCERAIAIKPDYDVAWSNRGIDLAHLGRYEEAIESHDQALAINPNSIESWGRRGYALYSLGQYEEAIESCNRMIAIKPDYVEALHDKGWIYLLWGKYPESINYSEQAIDIQPDRYDSWHNKGLAQFVTSDYLATLATWRQAFKYISNLEVSRYQDPLILIQEFIEELIPRFTQSPIQQTLLIPLLEIYQQANVITELGAALVNTLHLIVAPTISDHTANQWLALWRTSSLGNEPAMELPLRLMSTAIEYKKDPNKRDRLWLNLPSEERPILDKALKLLD